jgi:hypothetical protein
MADQDDRLAAALADVREKQFVARRLVDTRADRERLLEHMATTDALLVNEQADVDRIQHGVGGFFRRMGSDRKDLNREQQELAAVKLQQEALADELHAVEADLTQLCQREAKVADADQRYAALLAGRSAAVAPISPATEAFEVAVGRVIASRRELGEAIQVGDITRAALVRVQTAASPQHATDLNEVIARQEALRRELAKAQHAILKFQRECMDVPSLERVAGSEAPVMPNVATLLARSLAWTNRASGDDMPAEMTALVALVDACIGELRGRDEYLEAALGDLADQRAEAT